MDSSRPDNFDKKEKEEKQEQKQKALRKLRDNFVLEAMRYLEVTAKNPEQKISKELIIKQNLVNQFIRNIQSIDIEHDEKVEENLRKMKDEFNKKIFHVSPLHTIMERENISGLVTSFLPPSDQAKLSGVSIFPRIIEAKNKWGKEQLREPLINAIRHQRWLHSFAGEVEAMDEKNERRIVDDILFRLEAKNPDTNFEKLYLRYQKLERYGVQRLSEDQLTLLSDNVDVARRWVKENFNRLLEPFDNTGNCALHYLALSGHVKVLSKLLEQKVDLAKVKNFDHVPLLHLAALGGVEKEAMKFFNNKIMDISFLIERRFRMFHCQAVEDFAALGANMDKMQEYITLTSKRGSYDKTRYIESAASSGNIKMMFFCLEKLKCNLEGKYLPLHIAVGGNVDMVLSFPALKYKEVFDKIELGFQFYAAICPNPDSAIQTLSFARDRLKCDMQALAAEGVNIAHFCARLGRGKTLKYILEKFGFEKETVDFFNSGLPIYTAAGGNEETLRICDELQCNMRAVNQYGSGMQHTAFLFANLPIILICQLLELKMDALTADGKNIVTLAQKSKDPGCIRLARLIQRYSPSYHYPAEYQAAWESKAESIADQIVNVLDRYLSHPPATGWFRFNYDPYQYHDEAKALKTRVLDFKNKNPVDLFLCLNYRLLNFMEQNNISGNTNDQLVICMRFVTNKVLEHIHALRLEQEKRQRAGPVPAAKH